MRIPENDVFYLPVQSIEREALRCKALVQELLTFSRDRKPGTAPEEPVAVVESALRLIETQSRIRNVELRKEFSKGLPLFEVDSTQIQQVLINLCSNAMDAMPQGGRLTVSVNQKDSFIEIRVSDTGSGISPEIRQKSLSRSLRPKR